MIPKHNIWKTSHEEDLKHDMKKTSCEEEDLDDIFQDEEAA